MSEELKDDQDTLILYGKMYPGRHAALRILICFLHYIIAFNSES